MIKEGLHDLSFDISKGKVTARHTVMLNRVEEELPSASDVAKADEIKLEEVTENAARNTEALIAQSEGQETLPMCEFPDLDKQLRSIRALLKVEMAKKVKLYSKILRKKSAGSRNSETIPESMMMTSKRKSGSELLS